ncbi:hypothetical protein RAC60_21140 [Pantoea sp. BR_17]|nr:hypothetical protein [Pantoea stewartii]
MSAGAHCPLPLSGYEVWDIFPEKRFQQTERQRMKTALQEEKYSNQITRQVHDQERAYLALKAQAETSWSFIRRKRSVAGCHAGRIRRSTITLWRVCFTDGVSIFLR